MPVQPNLTPTCAMFSAMCLLWHWAEGRIQAPSSKSERSRSLRLGLLAALERPKSWPEPKYCNSNWYR